MTAPINVVRKPEDLVAYQLTTSDTMYTALKYMAAKGYSGHLNFAANGTPTMNLTGPQGNTSQSGYINDWIVVTNDTTAEIVPAAQASSLYQVA